ncbi:serum opacification factor [Streptococcus dysgalactiae]|uniref:serum opacification factor n=1 Tax=Streptococcus dysgalactiae TaxID=1334 RepID=UPI00232B96B9|nr:serum opacification factor [Streptococcus dysgalactiae]WCE85283.1 serum opacification factor [Streptococcus dysgalactiae]WCN25283.1 serum opacification factor [Streptococcus dysgalactiae]
MKMSNCKYKLRKLSVGLVSVGTMFTTTTVLANEVPQPTATVSPVAVESSSEEVDTSESVTTSEIEKVLDTKNVHSEPKSITTNVESEQTFEATADSQEESASLQPKSRSKRSTDLVSQQPQLMEIEKLTVDNEKTEVNIKDEKDDSKKLIKNRDGEQREIVDISREVKVDESKNELEVTLTVTPKEIDRGAEVIVLLDTSKKMTEEDFNTAKENIKKLVTTLTSNSTTEAPNHNSRNSVRLIDFYRHIGEPVELTEANADEKLTQVRQKAIDDYNGWGVDLQGAIHKAREIFSKEKNSGKRQHIVLFSQGEATFSYDIKDKNKLSKTTVKEPVTSSNPLLPWPFYFDSTTNTANLVKDGEKIKNFLKKLGINRYEDLLDGLASNGNTFLSFGSDLLGTNNPLDYITLSDLDTKKLTEENFDYSKILGEGYNFRSYYTRESSEVPLKNIVRAAVRSKIEKLKKKVEAEAGWLDVLGITKWSNSISKALGFDQLEEQMINKVIDYLFHKRNYVYYNHNLSAQAEAKMARDEGIVFYAFDVTDPTKLPKAAKYNNHSKEYTEYLKKKEEEAKALYKKRNDEFDKYLKAMSDGQDFLKYVEDKDKFKDILEEVTVTETFEDKVTVAEPSHYKDSNGDKQSVKHTSSSWFFSSTKESLTWTISKDELKKAFENEKPLTLTYKLKVNQVKFKEALSKARKKRSAATKSDDLLTESIISNKISYKINKKQANGKKLDDVKLTYGKEMVPVPEIDGEVIQPQIPQLPELPPVIEHGPNFDFTEDTVNQLPLEHGHYEPNTTITLTEDTKPEKIDTIIGGNVIDFTEDSITHNQYTESGHNSTNENQEIIEDTKPESDTISISGQSDPIEITEDTLSNQSGHSNDDTTIEDTKQPEVIMGGQANIVDMVEETQPGMSGFNESTVIEENTRPKLQFHFDNEEPNPAINKAISQTPIARVDNNLPQTGDKDKSEAFFTITALTVIGAAGLLSKKDRKNQID